MLGKLPDGVTGNTSGFGPEESRFEPWSGNSADPAKLKSLAGFLFLGDVQKLLEFKQKILTNETSYGIRIKIKIKSDKIMWGLY
jgi:hypothetical protein